MGCKINFKPKTKSNLFKTCVLLLAFTAINAQIENINEESESPEQIQQQQSGDVFVEDQLKDLPDPRENQLKVEQSMEENTLQDAVLEEDSLVEENFTELSLGADQGLALQNEELVPKENVQNLESVKSDAVLEQEIADELKTLDALDANGNQMPIENQHTPEEFNQQQSTLQKIQSAVVQNEQIFDSQPESQLHSEPTINSQATVLENESAEEIDNQQQIFNDQAEPENALNQMQNLMKMLTPEQLAQFQSMNPQVKMESETFKENTAESIPEEHLKDINEIAEADSEEARLEAEVQLETEQIESFVVPQQILDNPPVSRNTPLSQQPESSVAPQNGYGGYQNQVQQVPQEPQVPQVVHQQVQYPIMPNQLPNNNQYQRPSPYQNQFQQNQYQQNQYQNQQDQYHNQFQKNGFPSQNHLPQSQYQQNQYQQDQYQQNQFQQNQYPNQQPPNQQNPSNQYPSSQFSSNGHPPNEYPSKPQVSQISEGSPRTERPALGYSQQVPEAKTLQEIQQVPQIQQAQQISQIPQIAQIPQEQTNPTSSHTDYGREHNPQPDPWAQIEDSQTENRLIEDINIKIDAYGHSPKMFSAPGELAPIGSDSEETSFEGYPSVQEQPDQHFEGERHSQLQSNSGYNNYQKEQAKEIMQHEIENDALQELSDELPFNIVRKDEDGLVGVPDEHFEDMDRHYR